MSVQMFFARRSRAFIAQGGWIIAIACGSTGGADTINLVSTRDVTIYDSSGDLSNGAGPYCFVSKNGMNVNRRALIAFDLASIPPGSTITSATLTLNLSMTGAGSANVSLHRLDVSWGEGTSVPTDNGGDGVAATTNDATWTYRFFDTLPWDVPGGQFVTSDSATLTVGAAGPYSWSSAQMAADVQTWVNNPSLNHGWVLRGNEATTGGSKRFDTRENINEAFRPRLSVEFTLPCVGDVVFDGDVNVRDLLTVINSWGPCDDPRNCPADIAPPGIPPGDDTVNVADLLMVITHWGRCP